MSMAGYTVFQSICSDTSLHGKPQRIGTLILIFTKAESFRLALQKNVDPIVLFLLHYLVRETSWMISLNHFQ